MISAIAIFRHVLTPNQDKRLSIAISGPKGDNGVAEAGKVYDKGRNWTSVVLEVVPVGSRTHKAVMGKSTKNELDDGGIGGDNVEGMRQTQQEGEEDDDDVEAED